MSGPSTGYGFIKKVKMVTMLCKLWPQHCGHSLDFFYYLWELSSNVIEGHQIKKVSSQKISLTYSICTALSKADVLQICPHYSCIGTTTNGWLDDAISHSCRLPSFLFSVSQIHSYQTDILRQSDKNSTHSKCGPNASCYFIARPFS